MRIRKTLACNMLAHFQDMGKWRSYLFVRSAHTILTVGVAASLLVKDTELRDALVRFDDLSSQAIQRGFYVLAFFSLTIAALVMYYVTCLVDPGFVPLNIIEQEDEDAEESEAMLADTEESGVPLRRCGFCGIKQPLRARHCEDCQRCVRKYDHHCPWLDRCIGENNHKYFLLFLALKSVVIIWAALIVWRAFVWRPLWIEWLTTNMVFLLDLVILLPSGVAVSLLFFMHLYVALVNQTTWEIVSRERITYLKKLDVEVNPFHMGYIRNCLHFLFDCQAQRWDIIYKKYSSSPGYVESPV